jgi:hypothetical protein
MANVIHSRERADPGYNPSSRTLCFRCMERGTRFVFIRGSRKYACPVHFHEWQAECHRSERHRDRILEED